MKTFSIHLKWTRKSVLKVLRFFLMFEQCGAIRLFWRMYQTFFVNCLAKYHQMMSKQRFRTNLNSLLPKVNLNFACVLCCFEFFFWSFHGEKKTNRWRKRNLHKNDLKGPIWATWFFWAFDHFCKHCMELKKWCYIFRFLKEYNIER